MTGPEEDLVSGWKRRGGLGAIARAALAAAGTAALTLVVLATAVGIAAALDATRARALDEATYVYIASERKDGSFGTPAEIWFMHHDGAVFVASPTTTWRVRRIEAGRPKATVAIGKPDGPRFNATGSIVRDPALYDRLFGVLAKKYPERWTGYETRFREGLTDGSRVLIRYQPTN